MKCWPPLAVPPLASRLVLASVDYAGPIPEARSEIILGLHDPVTGRISSARLGVHDIPLALRVYQTLRSCEKMTLDQVAEHPIVSR